MVLLLQLVALVVVLDVVMAWVQPEPERWPRRILHAATEVVERPIRRVLPAPGGWDLSPFVVIAACGLLRFGLLHTAWGHG
jgi:uncharacterized protein YggT (Ycf19 family)